MNEFEPLLKEEKDKLYLGEMNNIDDSIKEESYDNKVVEDKIMEPTIESKEEKQAEKIDTEDAIKIVDNKPDVVEVPNNIAKEDIKDNKKAKFDFKEFVDKHGKKELIITCIFTVITLSLFGKTAKAYYYGFKYYDIAHNSSDKIIEINK